MNTTKKTIIYISLAILGGFLFFRYLGSLESFIKNLWHAATPILTGFVIAYIINIPMRRYEKLYFPQKAHLPLIRKTRRPLCLIASYLTILGILALIMILIIPKLFSCIKLLISEIPFALENLMESEKFSRFFPKSLSEIDFQEAFNNMAEAFFSKIGTVSETVFSAVSGVFSFTITMLLSIVFSVYILLKKEKITGQIKALSRNYLPRKISDKLLYISSVLNDSFHSFIVGQCLEAVILGILCAVGMYIFRFPYSLMIGTLIGFTAIIPIAGAFIGAGIGTIMILTQSPIKALLFILFIIILQQLEENLVYPKVVGKKIGLPAFYVLTAITIGGRLFGIPGILISVPIFSAIYKIIRKDLSDKSENQHQN